MSTSQALKETSFIDAFYLMFVVDACYLILVVVQMMLVDARTSTDDLVVPMVLSQNQCTAIDDANGTNLVDNYVVLCLDCEAETGTYTNIMLVDARTDAC